MRAEPAELAPLARPSPAAARAPEDAPGRWTRWALVAVLALAVALRLHGLADFPFEEDELYTEEGATRLLDASAGQIKGRPLYFLLQHPLLAVMPRSALWLRLLPFIFGVAGVWLTWRLGRALVGERAGLVGALLAAISPWHMQISGTARYWSLVYLIAAAAYLLLARAYDTDRPAHYAATLLALALGSATHPTFVFPVAGATLGVSVVRPDGGWGWRWPTRAGWRWLWLPYLALVLAAFAALWLTGNSGAVRNYSGLGAAANARLIPGIIEWISPVVFTAGALGAVALAADRRYDRRRWGAVASLGTLTAFGLLLAAASVTDVWVNYGAALLPLVFVSGGALVQRAAEAVAPTQRPAVTAAAAAVIAAGVLPSTVSHLMDGTRFDYRPALRRALGEAPHLLVLTQAGVIVEEYAPALRHAYLRGDRQYLDSLLAAEGELWALVSTKRYGIVGDDSGELQEWLLRHCRTAMWYAPQRLDFRMHRVDLMRCRSAPVAALPPGPHRGPRTEFAGTASGAARATRGGRAHRPPPSRAAGVARAPSRA